MFNLAPKGLVFTEKIEITVIGIMLT